MSKQTRMKIRRQEQQPLTQPSSDKCQSPSITTTMFYPHGKVPELLQTGANTIGSGLFFTSPYWVILIAAASMAKTYFLETKKLNDSSPSRAVWSSRSGYVGSIGGLAGSFYINPLLPSPSNTAFGSILLLFGLISLFSDLYSNWKAPSQIQTQQLRRQPPPQYGTATTDDYTQVQVEGGPQDDTEATEYHDEDGKVYYRDGNGNFFDANGNPVDADLEQDEEIAHGNRPGSSN